MKLYNKDGKLFEINPDTYVIGRGCYGDIHIIDNDTCVKTFRCDIPANPKVMEEIKNLKLYHFDYLKEILYDENGKLKAYIMKTLDRGLPDYFSTKTGEFIKIFDSLYKDVLTLTERHIYLGDMKVANTMNYRDVLKVIDYDYFSYSKSPKIRDFNNTFFLNLWRDILLVEISRYGYKDIIKHDYITPLFEYDERNFIITGQLDVLKKYNLVIDYFLEKENGKIK